MCHYVAVTGSYKNIGLALRLMSVVALLSVTGFGQSIGLPSLHPVQSVHLRIRLFTSNGELPMTGARVIVQLMDGSGIVQQEKPTDDQGNVQFTTSTGAHRVRVFGRGIEEYNGQLDIENYESTRVEILHIKLKKLEGADANVIMGEDTGAMVNVTGLKVPEKAEQHFKKAAQHLEERNWEQAKREFATAIKIYPDYDLAYNGLGIVAYVGGDMAAARSAFEKAIELNQHFAGAYRNLGRIYLGEHNWSRADELLTKSLQNEPLNAWALTNAAYAELQEKHFDDAIAHARKVHGLPHEGFANAHYIAALALEARERQSEALAEYEFYLKEAPSGPNAVRSREAVERLQRALKEPK